MSKNISQSFRYFIICLALLILAQLSPFKFTDRFYRFDRAHVFLPAFYAALTIIGVVIRPYISKNWLAASLKGAACGFVSGLIAEFIVVVINRHGLSSFASTPVSEISLSMLFMSIVFLTPFWGLLSALVVYKYREKFN